MFYSKIQKRFCLLCFVVASRACVSALSGCCSELCVCVSLRHHPHLPHEQMYADRVRAGPLPATHRLFNNTDFCNHLLYPLMLKHVAIIGMKNFSNRRLGIKVFFPKLGYSHTLLFCYYSYCDIFSLCCLIRKHRHR